MSAWQESTTPLPAVARVQLQRQGRVLVVYFSRTGHTRRVAELLARELGGIAVPIHERRSRGGALGHLRSLLEAVTSKYPSIVPRRPLPTRDDLVIVGTPIWGWHLASPVRTFARLHAARIRRVAFFCTTGGSGAQSAFQALSDELGRRLEATLALTERDVAHLNSESILAKVNHFVRDLYECSQAKAASQFDTHLARSSA